eukprot:scaffold2699_cov140-Skeletonema_marinoi.AAC.5
MARNEIKTCKKESIALDSKRTAMRDLIDGVKHTANMELKIFVRLIIKSCATWRWAPDHM